MRSLLARRAAEDPERPWLFHPDGHDWRWISRAAAAEAVAAASGSRAPADDPSPAAIFHLLASGPADAAPPAGARRLAAATGDVGTQVAVLARPAADPVARLLVGWSLVVGGALVVEPYPAALVATAAWARPTLFAGSGEEIERLGGEAQRDERSFAAALGRRLLAFGSREPRPRRPFGRLRAVVEIGGGGAAAGSAMPQADFWAERSVTRFAAADLLG